jgi:hypothetical protein
VCVRGPSDLRVVKGSCCRQVVSEREYLFSFCSREEENSPCHQGETDSHLIQRIGRCDEEAGR